MFIVELLVALLLAFGGGDAPMLASPGANPASLGEEEVEYQRPPKRRQPHPTTLSELKGMYQ